MSNVLTEQLPSSGAAPCDHRWQVVEGQGGEGKLMMVCAKPGCSASKLVDKPRSQESNEPKKGVLFG